MVRVGTSFQKFDVSKEIYVMLLYILGDFWWFQIMIQNIILGDCSFWSSSQNNILGIEFLGVPKKYFGNRISWDPKIIFFGRSFYGPWIFKDAFGSHLLSQHPWRPFASRPTAGSRVWLPFDPTPSPRPPKQNPESPQGPSYPLNKMSFGHQPGMKDRKAISWLLEARAHKGYVHHVWVNLKGMA